jgi:hypothetical protein
MVTKDECITAAEALINGNDLSRRNAARSLADYCRIILNEIGSHIPGYLNGKDISIKQRYKSLREVVIELSQFHDSFKEIQHLMDNIDNDETFSPPVIQLENIINHIKKLNQTFEKKISPDLEKLDKSQYDLLKEDWEETLSKYDSLDNYLFQDRIRFDSLLEEVRSYFPVVPNFENFDNQQIMTTRTDLQKLQSKIEALISSQREIDKGILAQR